MAKHKATHCHCPHPTILCDCPTSCFNCRAHKLDPKGHYAFNDTCLLKKNMHRHTSAPTTPAHMPVNPTAPGPLLAALTTPPPSTL